MQLSSRIHDITSAWDWLDLAYEKGWTDGLPVAPPTEERVRAMVEHVGRKPNEVLGLVAPQSGEATIEKVAIQCVMAGCKPEYFPVVLAALEAMMDPQFNLYGVETTTHACEPLTIVCGPIMKELGFNYGDGVFGCGRPNATIGRAIRLILWNIGGSYPGVNAKAPFSQPGRYSFCIAENVEGNPWPPMHRDFGVTSESGVVVFGCDPPQSMISHVDSVHTLNIWAETMNGMGTNNIHRCNGAQALVIIGTSMAQAFNRDGWTKPDIRKYLFEKARRRLGELKKGFYQYDPKQGGNYGWPKWINQEDDDSLIPIVADASDLLVAVAGGTAAHWFSVWCPGWGLMGGQAVARPIVKPGQQ